MSLSGFLKAGLFTALGVIATLLLFETNLFAQQQTNPTQVDGLKGYVLRVIHPGEVVTMEYREGRVNVTVGKDGKITDVKFY
ncbi:MAG TPA: I78 family peptidase inhibitor [Rhizomicrobium sp.]|jgi:hypothetical protein|nr:I78 family peptidase inhibitor [Rhizomicrobium sp.]